MSVLRTSNNPEALEMLPRVADCGEAHQRGWQEPDGYLIGAGMVPDFRPLDASTRGAITALIREDMQGIAADGISPPDAGVYIAELVDVVDPIRRREVEWLAHQTRRMLDGKPRHDA